MNDPRFHAEPVGHKKIMTSDNTWLPYQCHRNSILHAAEHIRRQNEDKEDKLGREKKNKIMEEEDEDQVEKWNGGTR